MSGMWAVCKREFSSYFVTPIGYVIIGVYSLITGLGFLASFLYYARISQSPAAFDYSSIPSLEETMLSPFLVFCGQILIFLAPLITMRLLAEEKNRGTMELMLTYPLRDRDIIFGKYLAALGMALIMMLVVGVYMAIVAVFATVEPAVLLFGMLTVFLMGAALISLGLMISALTSNQVTSGVLTFGLVFIMYVISALARDLSPDNPAPANWGEGIRDAIGFIYTIFRTILVELSIDAHARDMAQGIVQPEDIAYYVLFAAFFIFATFRVLESRKWRAIS